MFFSDWINLTEVSYLIYASLHHDFHSQNAFHFRIKDFKYAMVETLDSSELIYYLSSLFFWYSTFCIFYTASFHTSFLDCLQNGCISCWSCSFSLRFFRYSISSHNGMRIFIGIPQMLWKSAFKTKLYIWLL